MISVVIILKNDFGIVDTIRGLNNQDYSGDFEIIVVDRSTVEYPHISSKRSLRWIKFDPKGERFTIPEQRNVGVDEAFGNVIVFIDASCVPNSNWLTEITAPLAESEEFIVMGRTGSSKGKTLNDLTHEKLKAKNYVDEAPTINLAIKKSVFAKVGKFDESLDYGSDVDFSWRAIDSGFKIRYQPSAYVSHDWGDYRQEIKRTILYGRARARLIIKHREKRWKNILSSDSPVIVYPLLIIGLPIALFFPPYLLLFLLLIVKNIKEPNPVGIVAKHIVYGWGVLIELSQLIKRTK